MLRHFAAAGIALVFAGWAAAAETPAASAPPPGPDPATMRADAMKLCERLAGTEREICVQQARENERIADPRGTGATPGAPGGGAGRPTSPQSGSGDRNP